MCATAPADPTASLPSRIVAEALVKRHGPRRIANRAVRLGVPRPLTKAMIVACGAAAIEPAPAGGDKQRVRSGDEDAAGVPQPLATTAR